MARHRDPAPTASGAQGVARARRTVEEVSAGGLVIRADIENLEGALIAKHDRRGRLVWSLPKGHVEARETLEQTAAREVYEETGISGKVLGTLGVIDYWFVLGERKIHKTVHHFLFRAVAGELNDGDVEVVQAAWVPLADIPDRLSYADERRLIEQIPSLLTKTG